MSYYHELQKTMTEEKKRKAEKDFFAFYVGRPLSYCLTIPFLVFHVKPNTVSVISTIEVVISAVVLSGSTGLLGGIIGWTLFFLWNLLDGVDGNIARFRGISTPLGSVFDAMSGYAAMFLLFFSSGVYAFNNLESEFAYMQIILGSISGMAELFPRLVMHKAKGELGMSDNIIALADKENYGLLRVIGLNLTSITGMVQPLLLISVLLNKVYVFNYIYCFINVAVMLVSLKKILSTR